VVLPPYAGRMHVVVVDDEERLVELITRYLEEVGFETTRCHNGRQALEAAHELHADVMVLDLMLPGMSGIEVCQTLRREGIDLPILMLTARGAVPERVAGLEAGADDYLVKPFALQELLARVRALLRRSLLVAMPGRVVDPTDDGSSSEELSFADLHLHPGTREVRRGDRPVRLTRTEFSILEVFLRHPRQVLTRTVLFEQVWGFDFGENSNSLHVYLGYLRRKLEAEGGSRLLHTVRGVGFVLREEPL